MRRRRIDTDTKLAVVLEGLRGQSSIADICRKYGISESLFYKWRDKFLTAGRNGLEYGTSDREVKMLKDKIAKLERIIGKQAVQIEILKKIESYGEIGSE